MTKRVQKLTVLIASLAALAVGGGAIAQAQSSTVHQVSHHATRHAAAAPADPAEKPGAESPGFGAGSESGPSDGPGGHADEPGNANADHQFQGNE
jgi:hypothetical protein